MTIIFSIQFDISTTDVIKWLSYYGEKVIRINSDDDIYKFERLDEKGIYFENTQNGNRINLLEAKRCWWRRNGISQRNFSPKKENSRLKIGNSDLTQLIKGENNLLESETSDLRSYIYQKIFENCEINLGNPFKFNLNKLKILDLACKYGFEVPYYEIVSNLSDIPKSKALNDKLVSKSIANGIYEVIGNRSYYSYTELYNKNEFANIGGKLDVFPSMVMNLIEKSLEIRSFYLDGKFYSMAIFSQSSEQTKVDFRKYNMVEPNKCEPFQLPNNVEDNLRQIFQELKLNTGSVDLILNKKGEYVFLEINPVGQYGMTSEPCNYELDKIIAKYLINGRT